MTFLKSSGETNGAQEVLTVLQGHVERALFVLDAHIAEIERGESTSSTPVVKAAQDAHKAMLLLFEERKRIDQSREKAGITAEAGTLDLDAARDEIGRRLACLRDAGDSGELSE